jgi:hypothetical protein
MVYSIGMDVQEAIAEAEVRLDQLRSERAELNQKLKENNEEGHRVIRMLEGLRDAVAAFGSEEQQESLASDTSSSELEDDWSQLNRSAATFRAVEEIGEPVGPSQIVKFLTSKGRESDTIHLVSAALAHLAKQGKVGSIGRAQWVPSNQLEGPIEPDPVPVVRESQAFRARRKLPQDTDGRSRASTSPSIPDEQTILDGGDDGG